MGLHPWHPPMERVSMQVYRLDHDPTLHFHIKDPLEWGGRTPIKHGRGLCQGDPLSPPLQNRSWPTTTNPWIGTRKVFLHKIRGRGAIMRTSLYVDDAAVFMAPIKGDIKNLLAILVGFGEVSGLCTNFHKISIVPIQCNHLNLGHIL